MTSTHTVLQIGGLITLALGLTVAAIALRSNRHYGWSALAFNATACSWAGVAATEAALSNTIGALVFVAVALTILFVGAYFANAGTNIASYKQGAEAMRQQLAKDLQGE